MGAPLIPELRLSYLVNLIITATFGLLLFVVPWLADVYMPWEGLASRSAYLIGAAYLGAALHYTLVLRTNSWPQARYGLGGLVVFSLVLLVATAFDWDRFRAYHPITLAWLALYYLPPIGYPIFAAAQARRGLSGATSGVDVSPPWRYWLIARGVAYGLLAVLGLIFAGSLVDAWPWSISQLEVRIFMGQLAIVSWGGLVVLGDRRWQHLRLNLLLVGCFGAAQLIGLLVGSGAYDWSSPLALALPLLFLEWLLTPVALFATYRDR